jgi:hypothetical protein
LGGGLLFGVLDPQPPHNDLNFDQMSLEALAASAGILFWVIVLIVIIYRVMTGKFGK